MSGLEKIYDVARARQARVVFPEMEDARVGAATNILVRDGLCVPVGLADVAERHVAVLVAARGVKEGIARRMLTKPLYRAAAMVACGDADAMVAGADAPTRRVIEAASMVIGMEKDSIASSFFMMIFPDGREMVFADCAVNVAPDAAQLAAIARASHRSADALLGVANVAMLSFSTGTSGAGTSVDIVREAAEITRYLGPVQADAALNSVIAAKKGLAGGEATNVLVFPNLDAGNIAYKLCQELAGAQAIGPFLQGFRRPVCDLSRGASVDDIVAASVVTAAQA